MKRDVGWLWRHPDFVNLWAGQTVSLFGSEITFLALRWNARKPPLIRMSGGEHSMDRSFVARNNASRERLQALVDSLPADSFGLVIHGDWTIGATLAHLAAEDRRIQGWLEQWERQGVHESATLREWEQWAIRTYGENDNDKRLPEWLATDPQSTVGEVVAAATSIDVKIETLSPDLTEALLSTSPFWGSRRQWALDRSIHRYEHLDAIERVLALT